jgi:hypothetical protein
MVPDSDCRILLSIIGATNTRNECHKGFVAGMEMSWRKIAEKRG